MYGHLNPSPLVHPNGSLYLLALTEPFGINARRGHSPGGFMAWALSPCAERQRRALERIDRERRGPFLMD